MRKHHLPFLATDRSVLNLPAIGKSMTFQLVGLTEEGKRILRFEHDGTRHHSPIIDQMGQIYIVENKITGSLSTPTQQDGGRPGRLRFYLELYKRGNRTSFQPLRVSRFPLSDYR